MTTKRKKKRINGALATDGDLYPFMPETIEAISDVDRALTARILPYLREVYGYDLARQFSWPGECYHLAQHPRLKTETAADILRVIGIAVDDCNRRHKQNTPQFERDLQEEEIPF